MWDFVRPLLLAEKIQRSIWNCKAFGWVKLLKRKGWPSLHVVWRSRGRKIIKIRIVALKKIRKVRKCRGNLLFERYRAIIKEGRGEMMSNTVHNPLYYETYFYISSITKESKNHYFQKPYSTLFVIWYVTSQVFIWKRLFET